MNDNSPKDAAIKVKMWPKDSIAAGPRHTVVQRSTVRLRLWVIIFMVNVMLAVGII